LACSRPTEAFVRFDGDEVGPTHRRRRPPPNGYVIQDGGLFPHLSARDNVTLMARHRGWDAARIQLRVDELVALTRFPADALARFRSSCRVASASASA